MTFLDNFSISLQRLNEGIHEFEYKIDDVFFGEFEDSLIKKGNVDMKIVFEKRTQMYIVDFSFSGKVDSTCDRCLTAINLPIEGDNRLYVKFDNDEDNDEIDVIFLPEGTLELNFAQYIYEFINLSLPIVKTYDCEDEATPPCDMDMLDKLYPEEEEDKNEDKTGNPLWEQLKQIEDRLK